MNQRTQIKILILAIVCLSFKISKISYADLRVDLTVDHEDLYHRYTGIYSHPQEKGKKWQRPGEITLTDSNSGKTKTSKVGVRIHGGGSRFATWRKSFRLYFKGNGQGNVLSTDMLGEPRSYESLILKAGSNDSWNYNWGTFTDIKRQQALFVKDAIGRSTFKAMGEKTIQSHWVKFYLNGQFFGTYQLVERVRKNLVQQIFGSHKGWVIVSGEELKTKDQKGGSEWLNLVKSSPENIYQSLNIDNFISFMLVNLYLQNKDWPGHNWNVVKARGLQWTFMVWDMEVSLGSALEVEPFTYGEDTIRRVLASESHLGTIFKKLFLLSKFKKAFMRMAELYLNTLFSYKNQRLIMKTELNKLSPYFDDIISTFNENQKFLTDWKRKDITDWEKSQTLSDQFLKNRPKCFIEQIQNASGIFYSNILGVSGQAYKGYCDRWEK